MSPNESQTGKTQGMNEAGSTLHNEYHKDGSLQARGRMAVGIPEGGTGSGPEKTAAGCVQAISMKVNKLASGPLMIGLEP
jgi:hypothetical protein